MRLQRKCGAERRRVFSTNTNTVTLRASTLNGNTATLDGGGAGTSGGLPLTLNNDGSVTTNPQNSGSLDLILDTGVPVVVSQQVVASATSLIVTAAVAWTVNAYANKLFVLRAGTGTGQRRRIASNTATTLTLTQDLVTIPDTTSVFDIVTDSVSVDETMGVVTDTNFNPVDSRVGYLTRLSAAGVPYVDLTKPLTATLATGVGLPPMHALLGVTAYTVQTAFPNDPVPVFIVEYGQRTLRSGRPQVYVLGGTLYFVPDVYAWQGVTSLDLRYVPIAPAFTARTDYFLVGDEAFDAVVASGAKQAALIASAYADVKASLDMNALRADSDTAEVVFLQMVGGLVPPTTFRTREVW